MSKLILHYYSMRKVYDRDQQIKYLYYQAQHETVLQGYFQKDAMSDAPIRKSTKKRGDQRLRGKKMTGLRLRELIEATQETFKLLQFHGASSSFSSLFFSFLFLCAVYFPFLSFIFVNEATIFVFFVFLICSGGRNSDKPLENTKLFFLLKRAKRTVETFKI